MDKKAAPSGLWSLILVLGPSLIWCGEYIGSGEVILATRTGAILGTCVLWAVVFTIFLKYCIGLCGARYTVATGEGMVDLFGRMPGPKNWLVWVVFLAQLAAGICSVGALLTAAAMFLDALLPLGRPAWGVITTVVCFAIAWSEGFKILTAVMALLVGVIVVGVFYIAAHTLPGLGEFLTGLFGFRVPEIPAWARAQDASLTNSWALLLPLFGWAAGGFASQVWYTYWVLGAGYGMARERKWGQAADEARLKSLTRVQAEEVRPWLRVLTVDATVACVIGVTVTSAFLLAGAGILHPAQVAPQKEELVPTLSRIFSSRWSAAGGVLFAAAGAAAMVSTQLGQLAGWPRLLADCVRNIFPRFGAVSPTKRFRLFLCLFLVTNLVISQLLGNELLLLVTIGAVMDGLLLVPLQAAAVAWGLYVTQRKLLSPEAWDVLKPRPFHAIGLLVAFLASSYVCVFRVPAMLAELFAKLGG
ncbi:MAG: Nramp family divalent metal transporter [Planctomycetota bacterium]|nr:Nramp family divalent metal transporter [Planctomycetota bacterium]